MNGIEQKNHRRVTTELAQAIDRITLDASARFARVEKSVSDERTHRLALAREQRDYVDARDRELRECCQERWDETTALFKANSDRFAELRNRGLWSRLNWLLTGR